MNSTYINAESRKFLAFVIPANTYRDVGGRATQEAKAEAGIQLIRWLLFKEALIKSYRCHAGDYQHRLHGCKRLGKVWNNFLPVSNCFNWNLACARKTTYWLFRLNQSSLNWFPACVGKTDISRFYSGQA